MIWSFAIVFVLISVISLIKDQAYVRIIRFVEVVHCNTKYGIEYGKKTIVQILLFLVG